MMKIVSFFKKQFRNHWLAVVSAFIVGIIYIAPQVIFIFSLGDKYQGIPFMPAPNEDVYRARIQEIIDDHYLLGSPFFYEYKNQWPIMPPVAEMFYALPVMLSHLPLTDVLIAAKAVLPMILFFLIYFLIRRLTANPDSLSNKINAVAGGLWVTLGYDSVDYHTLWLLIKGAQPGAALVWSRPVHPIMGAIFLFSFLLLLWSIINNAKYWKKAVILAGILFTLMLGSYFFSWGLAFSITAILFLINLIKKHYFVIRRFLWLFLSIILFSLPYWYFVWQAHKSPWYKATVLRSGLFETHYPMINKLMAAVFILFIITIFIQIRRRKKGNSRLSWWENIMVFLRKDWQSWQTVCLAFILASFLVYSQQLITGLTVWPFHFVQYTIPLFMIIVCVLIYNLIKPRRLWFWKVAVTAIILISVALSIGLSINKKIFQSALELQSYRPVFDWLDKQKKDCVVLTKGNLISGYSLEILIPAFTHCNVYNSTWTYSLLPEERIYHSFLASMRLRGMSAEDVPNYLNQNRSEAGAYLSSNWKGIFDVKLFPDFTDPLLEKRIQQLPADYQHFLSKDFEVELKKYRLDFILSIGPISDNVIQQLPKLILVYQNDNKFVYSLRD